MLIDEIELYESVRDELRRQLGGRLPLSPQELESLAAENAYYIVLNARRKDRDWRDVLPEFAERAVTDFPGWQTAERRECELLRRELHTASGPLLDVGAGFGRLGSLYRELSLPAVFSEPNFLGLRLLSQAGLDRAVQAAGEALPFHEGVFHTAVVTWVLHHDTESLDAVRVLDETARILASGGRLLVVEPLDADFSINQLERLLHGAGFAIERVERFWETKSQAGETGYQTLVSANKGSSEGLGF